ncbi:MAG: hypothetical protein DRJ03_03305 [Chloroflexi bacterium]|nr:MAG: hypothetical protein DRJ03_03305 [Chloroflexota bacterium]
MSEEYRISKRSILFLDNRTISDIVYEQLTDFCSELISDQLAIYTGVLSENLPEKLQNMLSEETCQRAIKAYLNDGSSSLLQLQDSISYVCAALIDVVVDSYDGEH